MKRLLFPILQDKRFLPLLLILPMLTACVGSSPVTYYQLSAVEHDQPSPQGDALTCRTIGIGPVHIAEYLDRPQLVIRQGGNRVRLSGSHRWAEPIADNIAGILRKYLLELTSAANVVLSLWNADMEVNCQINVELMRFEGNNLDGGLLEAIWSIRNSEGELLVPQQQSEYMVNAFTRDYDGVVSALNEALFRLSSEIAIRLQQIPEA